MIEDDELPAKARFPKPRLPPTGKITSPRKRPIREIQAEARKKRKLEKEGEKEAEKEADRGGEQPDASLPNDDTATNNASQTEPASSQPIVTSTSNSAEAKKSDTGASAKSVPKPINKLRLDMPSNSDNNRDNVDPEKSADENNTTGIKTPESIPIAAH